MAQRAEQAYLSSKFPKLDVQLYAPISTGRRDAGSGVGKRWLALDVAG